MVRNSDFKRKGWLIYMKIRTWIKYEESYLPPRCRKLRYKRCEDYINANLTETSMDNVKLAFEDNSYSGKGKIYYFKNKLWIRVEKSHLIATLFLVLS